MSSLAGLTDPAAEKAHKKSFHRRNDSGELDVFEAARYFSGYNEAAAAAAPTMMMRKEDRPSWRGGGRISLDMPIRNVLDQNLLHHHHHHHHHHAVDHQKQNHIKEKIKYKQPSSPGGRLASFLNSLFNQSKKKPKSSQSMKDEDESPGGRRRRRSSISHFRSTSSTNDAKSIYSSSTSGFRTPPPYSAQITTAKSHKDWRISYSDHHKPQKEAVSNSSKHNVGLSHAKSSVVSDEKVSPNWLDDKFKLSSSEKYKSSMDHQDHNKGLLLKRLSEVVDDDEEDGADSDSSSDLFELQNYDLGGYYSSGLPVYETTNVDSIKNIRGTPIANAS